MVSRIRRIGALVGWRVGWLARWLVGVLGYIARPEVRGKLACYCYCYCYCY
jgi:hypothetical protein